MSVKRKIISALTAAALAVTAMFSLTGCSDVSSALTVDGESVPAGVYILYSGYALNNAQEQLLEEQPDLDTTAEGFDFYAQTVSGKAFGDFVKEETIRLCKRYVSVNRLYDELNIEEDPADTDDLNDSINSQWEYDVSDWTGTLPYLGDCGTMGEYYESIGVSKSSFKEVMTTSYKASNIFKYYYGEGGKEEVAKSDIKDYIKENYTLARYFGISLNDSEGNLIESKTELAVLENMAEDYAKMLNDGDSYSEVYDRYQQSLAEKDESDTADKDSDEDKEDEEDETDDSYYDRIISKDSTSPSEEFVKALFEQKIGTADVFKADTYYYVVQRLDITENDEYVEDYNDIALDGLKGDDMNKVFEDMYASYSVTENTGAPDYAAQQAKNASSALSTISTIQYYMSYYSSLLGGGY